MTMFTFRLMKFVFAGVGIIILFCIGFLTFLSNEQKLLKLSEEVGSEAITENPFNNGDAREQIIAIAPNGVPYLGWVERTGGVIDANGMIKINYWDSQKWVDISPELTSQPIEGTKNRNLSPQLSFDSAGILYMAWVANDTIYLNRWDGSSWDNLDLNLNQGIEIDDETVTVNKYSLIVDNDDKVYVNWIGIDNGVSHVYTKQWQGSDWLIINQMPIIHEPEEQLDIFGINAIVDSKNNLLILISSRQNNYNYFSIKQWNGITWQDYGTHLIDKPWHMPDDNIGTDVDKKYVILPDDIPSIAITSEDKIYLAWKDESNIIAVRYLDDRNSEWVSIDFDWSSRLIRQQRYIGNSSPVLTIDMLNNLYMTWIGGNGDDHGIFVAQLDEDQSWNHVALSSISDNALGLGSDNSTNKPLNPTIATLNNNTIYVAWHVAPSIREIFENNKLYIRQYSLVR